VCAREPRWGSWLAVWRAQVVELTKMDVCNASLLDEATAAAEAMYMSHALNSRPVFIVGNDVHPQTLGVVQVCVCVCALNCEWRVCVRVCACACVCVCVFALGAAGIFAGSAYCHTCAWRRAWHDASSPPTDACGCYRCDGRCCGPDDSGLLQG
jgi:hypothetical protein